MSGLPFSMEMRFEQREETGYRESVSGCPERDRVHFSNPAAYAFSPLRGDYRDSAQHSREPRASGDLGLVVYDLLGFGRGDVQFRD